MACEQTDCDGVWSVGAYTLNSSTTISRPPITKSTVVVEGTRGCGGSHGDDDGDDDDDDEDGDHGWW